MQKSSLHPKTVQSWTERETDRREQSVRPNSAKENSMESLKHDLQLSFRL